MNTSKPAGEENPPTKEPPTGKTQVQHESPHKGKKGNPRAFIQGNQRPHHEVPQNSYHKRSPYEDSWQSRPSGITETNKKTHLKPGYKERTYSQKEWKIPH